MPAADCVFVSPELLDERQKTGVFRHHMPDFRKRVHPLEAFLVAVDGFAIGASDIFRRIALDVGRGGGAGRKTVA